MGQVPLTLMQYIMRPKLSLPAVFTLSYVQPSIGTEKTRLRISKMGSQQSQCRIFWHFWTHAFISLADKCIYMCTSMSVVKLIGLLVNSLSEFLSTAYLRVFALSRIKINFIPRKKYLMFLNLLYKQYSSQFAENDRTTCVTFDCWREGVQFSELFKNYVSRIEKMWKNVLSAPLTILLLQVHVGTITECRVPNRVRQRNSRVVSFRYPGENGSQSPSINHDPNP